MTSIRDVAREAGVSPATVSRTFTAPNLLNARTQQRVLEAARILDYPPPRLRSPKNRPALKRRKSDIRPLGLGTRNAIGFPFFAATQSLDDTIATNTLYAPILARAQADTALSQPQVRHEVPVTLIERDSCRPPLQGRHRSLFQTPSPGRIS